MSKLASTLAIQSWCFRGVKDQPSVIRNLLACGVKNLEMCGYHINPTADADYSADLKLYEQAGIKFTCYGVEGFGADEARARKVFDFAKRCGIATLAVDLQPGGLETVEKLTKEYGIRVGIHNHGRRHHLGSPIVLEELFKKASPNVGLVLDTAWMLDSGYDPVEMAQKFRDRLYGVHVKDFIFDRAGKPEDVVVGTGNLKLDDLLKFLITTNWSGSFTLEYEGDVNNPVPKLTECVKAIQTSLARVGG
ncbi:MAG: sugar phosphate isomerase/epimerase [Phycisphaerae bacterium]